MAILRPIWASAVRILLWNGGAVVITCLLVVGVRCILTDDIPAGLADLNRISGAISVHRAATIFCCSPAVSYYIALGKQRLLA